MPILDAQKAATTINGWFLKSEILGADKGAARMGTGQDPGGRYRGEGADQVQIEGEEAIYSKGNFTSCVGWTCF